MKHLQKYLISCFKTNFVPAMVGSLSFFIVVGYERLIPSNTGWIFNTSDPDTSTQYLGTWIFRNSPWAFPPGINSGYLGGNTALVYSGGIPIIEFPMKLLRNNIDSSFQYLGIWLLICFILQAISSNLLLLRIQRLSEVERQIAVLLFCFTPIFLWRVNWHIGLSAQFLIVFALYLSLESRRSFKWISWAILLSSTLLIHAYFFAICFVIYLAALATYRSRGFVTQNSKLLITKKVIAICLPVMTAYLAGYFVNSSGWKTGFSNHLFKMDLAQPFNFSGFSWFFAPIAPMPIGNPEGFNYLGVWAIVLILFLFSKPRALFLFIKEGIFRNKFLFCALFGLFLYALSNQITFLRLKITVPLPEFLLAAMEVFRASGRFFWPIVYVLYFVVVAGLVSRFKAPYRVWILVVVALVHIADTSYYWRSINDINNQSTILIKEIRENTEIISLFEGYTKIVYIPDLSNLPKVERCFAWEEVGYLAAKFKLSTNCNYLARHDLIGMQKYARQIEREMTSGNFDEDSIYLLRKEEVEILNNPKCGNFHQLSGLQFFFPKKNCQT